MNCQHCGATIRVRKSLRRNKSAEPDDCPDCGEPLGKENPTRLNK